MPAPRSDVREFILKHPGMAPPAVAKACGVVVGTVYNTRKELRQGGNELPRLGRGGRKATVPGGAGCVEIKLIIGDGALRALRREADARSEPVDGLMARLLDVIAADKMVAAVLDDAP